MRRFTGWVRRWQTSLHDRWMARVGFVFAALLLIALIWLVVSNPEATAILGRVGIALLEVGALALLVGLLVWRWRQRDTISVVPFENLTGDDAYKAVAAGFADLLTAEIQRIHRLHTEAEWLGHRRQAPAFTALREKSLPSRLGEASLSRVGASGGKLGETLEKVGAVGVGPLNIPLGSLLAFVLRLFQPGTISGNFQKHGDTLCIVVNLKARGRPTDKWVVEGETGADLTVVGELASQLAYRMINDTSPSIAAKTWQGFKAFSEGLEHYRRFLLSGTLDQEALDEARRSYEEAVALEPAFALAHYNLGVAYDESGMPEAAIEAYKLALALDPGLARAYHGLGLTYLEQGRVPEAIEPLERAVWLNPNPPRFQQDLAFALMTTADFLAGSEPEVITGLLQRAVAFYEGAIAGYEAGYKEAQDRREGQDQRSDDTSRWFLENQASAWRELGQTWLKLAHQYEEEAVIQALNQALAAFAAALDLNRRDASSWMALGDLHRQLGDYYQAADHFHEALAIEPDAVEAHLGLGQVYLEHGEAILQALEETESEKLLAWQVELAGIEAGGLLDKAAAEFRAGLDAAFAQWEVSEARRGEARHQAPPQAWVLLERLAVALLKPAELERHIEARSFRELLALEPGEGAPAYPAGEIQAERIDAASRVLNWALALTPDLPAVHDDLAVLYELSAADEAAQAHAWLRDRCAQSWDGGELRQALEEEVAQTPQGDPIRRVYLTALGWLLRRQGKLEEAVNRLEEAMEADAGGWLEVPQVQHELGLLYRAVNDHDKAIAAFQKADPGYIDEEKGDRLRTLFLLGDLYFEAGDYDRAIEAYGEAGKLAGENVYKRAQSLASRGLAYWAKKRYARAITDCQAAIEMVPLYTFARVTLCQIYNDMKDYERAVQEAQWVIQTEPRYALPHQILGDAYRGLAWACSDGAEKESWREKATAAYQQAVELWPSEEAENKANALMSLAGVLMERKRYAEAVKAGEQAVALGDELPYADAYYRTLGEAHRENKAFLAAREAFEKAIELGRKQTEEVKSEEERRRHGTEVAWAQNLLAYMYAEQGVRSRLDEGLELIEQALRAARDDDSRAAFVDTRGWLYFQQAKYDEAIEDLEAALHLDFGTTEGVYHLARAYEAKATTLEVEGEKQQLLEAARTRWKQVLELEPEGKWAQEAKEHLA